MIERLLTERALQTASWFPVVSVTGPRQSGKSTLVRAAFSSYEYLNLENPETRRSAQEDPVGFLRRRGEHIIIDEAQHVPELFSMVQALSDERGTAGQYVLSGSQNFLLLRSIQQSLAGRVGMLRLLPLSYAEAGALAGSVDAFMLRGGYPRLYDTGMPRDVFMSNYLATYVERDVGELLSVRDLASFRTFMRLLAESVGGLVNYARLATDVGVSVRTIRSWLSILESSYVAFVLSPYSASGRKRLTKTPKLYFYDTGLLCHLLQIEGEAQLLEHPLCGEVFENLVVSERVKRALNEGREPELYFYRDDSKREIDLLDFTNRSGPLAIELKAGETYHDKYGRHLRSVGDELGVSEDRRLVVYRGSERYRAGGIEVVPVEQFLLG